MTKYTEEQQLYAIFLTSSLKKIISFGRSPITSRFRIMLDDSSLGAWMKVIWRENRRLGIIYYPESLEFHVNPNIFTLSKAVVYIIESNHDNSILISDENSRLMMWSGRSDEQFGFK